MNYQNNLSAYTYYIFVFTVIAFFVFIPVWGGLLLLTLLIFMVRPGSNLIFIFGAVAAILSAVLISSINVSGDIESYKAIYDNIYLEQYTEEFSYEPFLILFYRMLHSTGASFSNVLFIQALIMNLCILYSMVKTFGLKGVNYYPLILIYPQYIQLSLFLSRQSWSVVFILVVLSLLSNANKNKIKKTVFSLFAISAHLISLFYLLLTVMSGIIKRLGWKTFVILWLSALLLPVTVGIVQSTFAGLFSYSAIIDRKIGFYLNSVKADDSSSSMSLFSLSVIPLHIIFVLNIIKMYKNKILEHNVANVIFLIIYMAVLITINYPLLPGRLGLIILMFAPYFYFNTIWYQYRNGKFRVILEYAGLALIILMYIRFIYTNDFGDYNVKLADGNLLSLNVLGFFQ